MDAKAILRTATAAVFVFSGARCLGQDDHWLTFPQEGDTLGEREGVPQPQLDYSLPDGRITVYKDESIDALDRRLQVHQKADSGGEMDGFRLLIYFDQGRHRSEQKKADFVAAYPHKAYIDYAAPYYRLRVGNFRTRLEAEKFKRELLPSFPTTVVVPDRIELPPLLPLSP